MTNKSLDAPIRILIADDHEIVREGLRSLIGLQPDMELVGEAANGLEAVSLALTLQPDVILIDLAMPHQDGLIAIAKIKQALPQARILVLTGFSKDEHVFPAVKAGALGYLLKDTPREELLRAITEVAYGRAYWPPAIATQLAQGMARLAGTPSELTTREVEILRLLARGLTNEQIAWQLYLSANTVARHINSILTKLDLTNRTQAVLFALRHGLATLD
ncbi:MAG: response regulator transcription factor [Anaerolineae bacterium]|nr:response regulator transcription factor [Anaerolineae bacterium]